MEDSFSKIEKLALGLNIAPLERIWLLRLFTHFAAAGNKLPFAVVQKDPAWLMKILDNYRAKKAAALTHSAAAWNKIFETEKAALKEYSSVP